MTSDRVYLRPDVQVDPLINRWYAWIQIIPPAPAAFNVIERQVTAMKSFIKSPDLHAAALKNPAMRGGPFIDLDATSLVAVKTLLEDMLIKSKRQMAFVEAVRTLDTLLEERGSGYSLQALYTQIPSSLRGYVELFYDRHHRADFRLFEALLYNSSLYDEGSQSVSLRLFEGDSTRPFIFSTPRLADQQSVNLAIPFRSGAFDALFSMKAEPQTLTRIEDQLGVDSDKREIFRGLFTDEGPAPRAAPEPGVVRLRYFGHACVLVEAGGLSILVDPLIGYPSPPGMPRFSYQDLPPQIDYVLITHSHHDHVLIESLLQLRHKIKNIVVPRNAEGAIQDPSLRLMLENLGFRGVVELSDFQGIDLNIGAITGLPFLGEHHDLQVLSKLCYHLRLGRRTMIFAADFCNFQHGVYEEARRLIGDVEILFIGIETVGAPVSWVYGPLFTKKPQRDKDASRQGRGSNYEEAMSLVELLNCSQVYIYAMGLEPWLQYIFGVQNSEESDKVSCANRLVETCRAKCLHAERLYGAKEIMLSLDSNFQENVHNI